MCPRHLIEIAEDDLRQMPTYLGEGAAVTCLGCERCVRVCPGLAITLVDARDDPARPLVTVPFEFGVDTVRAGDLVTVADTGGAWLGELEAVHVRGVPRAGTDDRIRAPGGADGTLLVQVRAPAAIAARIAGVRRPGRAPTAAAPACGTTSDAEEIVCRCERVTAGELRALLHAGVRDVHELKALVRAELGACGGKTCAPLIARLFRDAGVGDGSAGGVPRPPFVEVPLAVFAGVEDA